MDLLKHIRGYLQRPLVRPWTLAGPVLILMICLPLLRPLREPDPTRWHDEEQMIAATVQAIVEQHTLAIDKSVFADNPVAVTRDGHVYSPYSPMLPALLAPFYWVLLRQGLGYSENLIFVQYLLTIIGSALPVALCVGLVYRLARMFELRRSVRVSLGIACVLCTGLISYSVLLNRHAPAALFLLIALSAISHLAVAGHPHRHLVMAVSAGIFAALAATVDPTAAIPAMLLCLALLAMRWTAAMRAGAVVLYLLGSAAVVMFNVMLLQVGPANAAVQLPGAGPELIGEVRAVSTPAPGSEFALDELDEESDTAPSFVQLAWAYMASWIGRALEALVGEHGILSHFPMLVVGLLGATWVLHRNWTATTKSLAGLTLISCVLVIITYTFSEYTRMSYGTPWFVALAPVLMLWSGAWLKHTHRRQSWIMVGSVFAFSAAVGLVGMRDPMPREGYSGYSFAQATVRMWRAAPSTDGTPTTRPTEPEGAARSSRRH